MIKYRVFRDSRRPGGGRGSLKEAEFQLRMKPCSVSPTSSMAGEARKGRKRWERKVNYHDLGRR
jgi:hypothetical protein